MCPRGDPEEVRAAYQESWGAVEVLRVLVTRPETWEATFTVGLEGLLLPGERLSLPGAAEALLWVGGDATLERAAATDWEAKAYYVAPVEPFLGALEEAAGVQHREVTIALGLLVLQHRLQDGIYILINKAPRRFA